MFKKIKKKREIRKKINLLNEKIDLLEKKKSKLYDELEYLTHWHKEIKVIENKDHVIFENQINNTLKTLSEESELTDSGCGADRFTLGAIYGNTPYLEKLNYCNDTFRAVIHYEKLSLKNTIDSSNYSELFRQLVEIEDRCDDIHDNIRTLILELRK